MNRRGELFSGQYFHDFEQGHKSSLLSAVHGYDANAVLQNPVEELSKYFEERFFVPLIVIKSDLPNHRPRCSCARIENILVCSYQFLD